MEPPGIPVYHHSSPGTVSMMNEQAHNIGMPVDMDMGSEPIKNHSVLRHNPGRYKVKFQEMRERFEKSSRQKASYEKQLEAAANKMKKLQAENDLLLDSLLINDEGLYNRFFPESRQNRPQAPQEASRPRTPPIPPHAVPAPLRRSRRVSNSVLPNGSMHKPSPFQANGSIEHRPPEPNSSSMMTHPYERPLEFIAHDGNGRM
ncbi:hypothetical protein FA15DRAFT_672219 [Coprinopsis marcescibilis]|uniref:Uncharacterized protein n=1 Tax=Coprinopsis marcescibilis TaxID=230819 RepID=A0A5C3KMT1_COPMA|nr:hypothetical protein FA15DRAFT_672219 [Coprinopsis marcescibilis]